MLRNPQYCRAVVCRIKRLAVRWDVGYYGRTGRQRSDDDNIMWKYFYILQNILIFIHHIIANAGGSRRKTFANIMHLVEIKLDRTQWGR